MAKELYVNKEAVAEEVGEEVGEEAGEEDLSLYKVTSIEPGEAVTEFVQRLERLVREPFTFYYEHDGFGCGIAAWNTILLKLRAEQKRKETGRGNRFLLRPQVG